MTYGLGIDTGGTYTDSVIMDFDTGEVVSRAKDLTTRNDLVIGISGSIGKHDRALLEKVGLVSLSSTLATNSVVEGKGCRVGLVNIGKRYDGNVPADLSVLIQGSHDLHGKEKIPLDEESARRFFEESRGKVDALAITGYLSIRNPSHELRLAEMAREIMGVPVVLGSDLSSSLGYNERTTTALMNARLIPVIADLIRSVRKALEDKGISAPLMIVKGDGSIIDEASAMLKPIETVLSGPASSITGARRLTGAKDAVIVDIGGTTTDVGVLRNGRPRLDSEGALIGGMRTHVRAAAVSAYGIGGDSRIVVNGTVPSLTSVRVIPLCIAASKWPVIRPRLEELARRVPYRQANAVPLDELVQELEFFTAARPLGEESLQGPDAKLLELISERPYDLEEAGERIGVLPYMFNVSKLEKLGLLTRIGVTPTDILHAEGSYVQYDAEASAEAVGYLARKCGLDVKDFIKEMKDMITFKIARSVVGNLIMDDTGHDMLDEVSEDLVAKAITGRHGADYGISIKLDKPLIGIGAPVASWLPRVAEILGTELLLPKDSDVGNAIGAISGSVFKEVALLIQPDEGAYSSNPSSTVLVGRDRVHFKTLDEAISFAKDRARELAVDGMGASGVTNIVVDYDVDKKVYGTSDAGNVVLEATVIARATGKPDVMAF